MGKTAILVDGGFYRYRAYSLWGDKSPEDRANELIDYCYKHLKHSGNELYRIFFMIVHLWEPMYTILFLKSRSIIQELIYING